MPTDKRPRIRADLTAHIDEIRGDVPYEKWVNRAIEWVLQHRDGVELDTPLKRER
jgi:hypothetical protein